MRLIDADVFESNMQNEWERNEISNGEWIHFREMLNAEPTIEPERKTGEWINFTNSNNYMCSVCGRMLVGITEGKNKVAKSYPYCHCGARMEGR